MRKGESSATLNNIDLGVIGTAKESFAKEGGHHYVEKSIEGEYRLDGSPSFVAELRSDMSSLVISCDEPKTLGGRGVHASPLSYVLFGVMACFANSLAIQCGINGVKLGRMRVRGRLSYDIGPVLSDIDSPLIKRLDLEIDADRDVGRMIELTKERCPALYLVNHAVKTEVRQSSRRARAHR